VSDREREHKKKADLFEVQDHYKKTALQADQKSSRAKKSNWFKVQKSDLSEAQGHYQKKKSASRQIKSYVLLYEITMIVGCPPPLPPLQPARWICGHELAETLPRLRGQDRHN